MNRNPESDTVKYVWYKDLGRLVQRVYPPDYTPDQISATEIAENFDSFKENESKALDYLVSLCERDPGVYEVIFGVWLHRIGIKVLPRLKVNEIWQRKPSVIGRLITELVKGYPQQVELIKPFLKYADSEIIKKYLHSGLYDLFRMELGGRKELFKELIWLLLKNGIEPPIEYKMSHWDYLCMMLDISNLDTITYTKPVITKILTITNRKPPATDFFKKFYETDDSLVKLHLSEIVNFFYIEQENSYNLDKDHLNNTLHLANMRRYYQIGLGDWVKFHLDSLNKELITIVNDYLKGEDFLELLLPDGKNTSSTHWDDMKSTYIRMPLPLKGDNALCGAFAAANAILLIALAKTDMNLFQQLFYLPEQFPGGLRQTLIDYQLRDEKTGEHKTDPLQTDFNPAQMQQLFKEKNLPHFSKLLPEMKKLNTNSAMSMIPIQYDGKAEIGNCDPLLMLKLIRNLIKLLKRFWEGQIIAHPFLVFLNNSHWLCLNVLAKKGVEILWLVCESEDCSDYVLGAICDPIENLLLQKQDMVVFINKILLQAYQEFTFFKEGEVKPNELILMQMKSLLKTWTLIAEDKNLNSDFRQTQLTPMKRLDTVLQKYIRNEPQTALLTQCLCLNKKIKTLSIFTSKPTNSNGTAGISMSCDR